MKIYFTRHGETDWNTEKRKQGRTDTELNQKGLKQAQELRDKLKNLRIDVCYTSPLKRAKTTAKIAVQDKCRIIEDFRLIERSFGEYEGKILSFKNGDLGIDIDDLMFNQLPGDIELARALIARVQNFLDELKRSYPDDTHVLIVGHGGLSKAIHYCLAKDGRFSDARMSKNCELKEYNL